MDTQLISIIVVCDNQEQFVAPFLDSVLSQRYTNIEVIFVDNDSEDDSYGIATSYMKSFSDIGFNLSVKRNKRKLLIGGCRLAGRREMEGTLLYYADISIPLPADFTSVIVRKFESNGGISAVIVPSDDDNPVNDVAYELLSKFQIEGSQVIIRVTYESLIARHGFSFLRHQDIYTNFLRCCVSDVVFCEKLKMKKGDQEPLKGTSEDLLLITERYTVLLACLEKAKVLGRNDYIPIISEEIAKLPLHCLEMAEREEKAGFLQLKRQFTVLGEVFS